MRHCLIFSVMLLTGCSWLVPVSEPVYVERPIPDELTTPCAEPVKGQRIEGGFAELALGWRYTARCNAGKLEDIAELTGPR
ncbi:hypothetical protein PhaeoP24_04221 (plasmid) [Phaeobacter inhibens]|uniref:Rz1-like lysis system protein LysC n=1 Tax=Phaeobacter inhibens TaxID=221822 RepID=UPI000CA0D424|nr:hypothetical protein [Phaeobacter inhibens]AUQ92779.1 hypothetical protein PhaeoP24_04221 [Phaeobacter inhibens]